MDASNRATDLAGAICQVVCDVGDSPGEPMITMMTHGSGRDGAGNDLELVGIELNPVRANRFTLAFSDGTAYEVAVTQVRGEAT